jgi:HPt (histidine-containing phosphotransfer) domain-containing protein
MSKHELQRVKMETSPEATGERCTILGLQDWTQREREIHSLSKEAHELGQKQQESVRISQRLEQRIKQGELAYGEMLRRSLELHRALEKRRQHIYEDKSTLEKEVISAKSMGDRINAIMAEIMSITTKTDASSVKSET